MAACYRALQARNEIDVHVFAFRLKSAKKFQAFDETIAEGFPCQFLDIAQWQNTQFIASLVRQTRPDVIYIPGWSYQSCNALVWNRQFASIKFIMGMDTPWWGTWRQHLLRFRLRRLLEQMDRVVVPGERAWQSAHHLGVPAMRVCRGAQFSIDERMWDAVFENRIAQRNGWPKRFLYVGQYTKVKALDVLMRAYESYRKRHEDPWPLSCCGKGPFEQLVNTAENVKNHGFVQPSDLPAICLDHGVFVNAARYDPWPLVIVEACRAGLPVIASETCGSIVELLRPYYNGLTVPSDNISALARAFAWMHAHGDQLAQMGRRSHCQAHGFGAEDWADRWVHIVRELVDCR